MDITLEKQNPTDASIKVTLNEADYQPKVNEKLKEYGRKAQIKGFRPGKVPPSLIRKMYGKSILIDEINHMLSHAVSDYIKENKLPVVGEPLPNVEAVETIDWDTQKEFEFSYDVGLVADFQYDLSAIELTAYEVEVSDAELNETIDGLRKRFGNFSQPDTAQEGDFLFGTLKQVNGDFEKEKAFISLEQVKPDVLPTFVGVHKDDTVTFDIQHTFADAAAVTRITGLDEEAASALTGEFTLTVTDIDRTEPAELDQAFFDKVVGKDAAHTEEEFREKFRETLRENYRRESDSLLTQQIQRQLIDNTPMELPDEFLKKWLMASNDKVTPELLEKEYDAYARELKWNLLKNRIGEDAGIKVEHDEVLAKTRELIAQQFGSMGMGQESEETMNRFADSFLKAEQGKNYVTIFERAFADKVTEHVKSQATITPTPISADAFRKIDAPVGQ